MINDDKLVQIINYFTSQDTEKSHVEFKMNKDSPEVIAKNISGITNIMIKDNITRGYIIWGIDDKTHEIVGTKFQPEKKKKGNEDLILWLKKSIYPEPEISFHTVTVNERTVVLLIICANRTSVSKFNGTAYVRIDKNTRALDNFPETEKQVWREVVSNSYETMSAMANLSIEEVENLLDLNTFYEMRKANVSVERDAILPELISCNIIIDNKDSTYDITNLGALLLARDIRKFDALKLKAPRVIIYDGDSKVSSKLEQVGVRGYAIGFKGLHNFIMEQVNDGEEIIGALRKNVYRFPPLTIRELLANTIIHQDFTIEGTQPMIEIFNNRIVFTNAGRPIVPEDRFVDYPPTSRNQKMADELFKLGICEKRGTGWDKIAEEASKLKYPAPSVSATNRHTIVTLTRQKRLVDMTQEEKMWSIYINACYLWVEGVYTTNSTIRELFDIDEGNKATASRLLNQAVKDNKIKVFDTDAGSRSRKYVPIYESEGEL